jgi:hypothetical protein
MLSKILVQIIVLSFTSIQHILHFFQVEYWNIHEDKCTSPSVLIWKWLILRAEHREWILSENEVAEENFTFCWPCIIQWFLVNDHRDAQIPFYVFIFIYNSLHVSSNSCSSSGETNCINTTSGKCHSVLVAVSCAGLLPYRVTVTRGCIDTICFSWWCARGARNT